MSERPQEELTAKPPIEDMPPEEGVEAPTDQEEHELGEPEFLDPKTARDDETIDDQEDDTAGRP